MYLVITTYEGGEVCSVLTTEDIERARQEFENERDTLATMEAVTLWDTHEHRVLEFYREEL